VPSDANALLRGGGVGTQQVLDLGLGQGQGKGALNRCRGRASGEAWGECLSLRGSLAPSPGPALTGFPSPGAAAASVNPSPSPGFTSSGPTGLPPAAVHQQLSGGGQVGRDRPCTCAFLAAAWVGVRPEVRGERGAVCGRRVLACPAPGDYAPSPAAHQEVTLTVSVPAPAPGPALSLNASSSHSPALPLSPEGRPIPNPTSGATGGAGSGWGGSLQVVSRHSAQGSREEQEAGPGAGTGIVQPRPATLAVRHGAHVSQLYRI